MTDPTDPTLMKIFLPASEARRPGVLVLGGSDGGMGYATSVAQRLAQCGYAAMPLAYFGVDGLPGKLAEIDLGYFKSALARLQDHPAVDGTRIGLYGVSKGAEAALLIASRNPAVRAVVAAAPSDVVWESLDYRTRSATNRSSWSEHGAPLPFVSYDRTVRSRSVKAMYERSLALAEDLEGTRIPVERINGAVLFLSGDADGIWPSKRMAERAVARMLQSKFAHGVEHMCTPGAGHAVFPLFRLRDRLLFFALQRLFGGTRACNRAAQAKGWEKTLSFLAGQLGPQHAELSYPAFAEPPGAPLPVVDAPAVA